MSKHKKVYVRSIFLLPVFFLVLVAGGGICTADSLWNNSAAQPRSLYSATKGEYKIGDIITILIVESFKASNTASTATDKETDLGIEFQGFDNYLGLSHLFGTPIAGDPRFGVGAENDFDGTASSRRSSSVTGTVSGQITEILLNNNLRIEASQTTVINGERNSVILVGTIRPEDISAKNTVYSTQVSNAEIRYDGKGSLSNVQKRGILTEFLEFVWPF
jgi:flagellar L-ring protein precursor FlgH